jgi:hypothetical protein
MSRRIDLSVFDADPRVIAWLDANGIDANHTPAAQEVLIEGDQLTYIEFLLGLDGCKVLSHRDDGSPFYEKQLKTVTLVSAPENFGL